METFNSIIDYIARTNLFNFIIFAAIIFYVLKKLNISLVLDNMKDDIVEKIETSKEEKEKSEIYLKDMKEVISCVGEEIDRIIQNSDNNAQRIGQKVLSEAEVLVLNIQENSEKLVENKTAIIKNDILKRAANASVEVAKNHIKNELNNNYDLHNKLIDESIEAIGEVKL